MDDDGGATPHYTRHAHDLEYSTSEDDEAAARSTIPHDMMMGKQPLLNTTACAARVHSVLVDVLIFRGTIVNGTYG